MIYVFCQEKFPPRYALILLVTMLLIIWIYIEDFDATNHVLGKGRCKTRSQADQLGTNIVPGVQEGGEDLV